MDYNSCGFMLQTDCYWLYLKSYGQTKPPFSMFFFVLAIGWWEEVSALTDFMSSLHLLVFMIACRVKERERTLFDYFCLIIHY